MAQIPQPRPNPCLSLRRRNGLASISLLCVSFFHPALAQDASTPASGVTTSVTGDVQQKKTPKTKSKDDRAAEDAYINGARLLERNDRAGAEKQFTRATELAPDNNDYALALSTVREGRVTQLVQSAGKARLLGKTAEAETMLAEARKIDPTNTLLLQHPDPKTISQAAKARSWLVDGPRLAGPVEAKPKPGLQTFHIKATMPEIVRQVAAAYGLKVFVDSTVEAHQARFDLEDVPYAQAMHILMDMGPLFVVPLTPDTILVAKDSTENREKYEHQIQETIYAAGMSNDQLAELGNMIRNVFEVKQLSVENSFGTLVVRAPAETIRVLNLTIGDMLDGGAEVMLDLKLYSIDKTRTRNIGLNPPTEIGAFSIASEASSLVAANQTLINQAIAQGLVPAGTSDLYIVLALIKAGLITSPLISGLLGYIGGGISEVGVSSSTASTLNLALNSADTRALDEIQLRVGDRQSATFRAGSKYPITQSTYATTVGASTSSLAGATINGVSVASLLNSATSTSTIPQVQYEDLGVTLKATPTIQRSGLISLHLDLKIESLAGGTIDNIPVLNNNAFTSDITVADGTTAFLVSNMTKSESAAVSGIPGLSELPGFQRAPDLLRTTDEGQLLIVITPHLTRRRTNEMAGPVIPIQMPATISE
jgi:general secretion pathway protein D